MGIYEELEWRGLIKDVSDPVLREKLNKGGMTFYIGTDPTGDSLHIGHFSSFLICKRLKDAGHNPIVLVGGATGLIGDPKPDSERPMITYETVNHNFECLKSQLTNLFGCEVVNNYDWSKDLNFIEEGTVVDEAFLYENRVIGKMGKDGLKVLGNGELTKAITIKANKFTNTAKEKIEKIGGKVEVL